MNGLDWCGLGGYEMVDMKYKINLCWAGLD